MVAYFFVHCSDLSTPNLIYLSSEQALADLAYFCMYMSDKMQLSGNKWIAFGGSYPGNFVSCKIREIMFYGACTVQSTYLHRCCQHRLYAICGVC